MLLKFVDVKYLTVRCIRIGWEEGQNDISDKSDGELTQVVYVENESELQALSEMYNKFKELVT